MLEMLVRDRHSSLLGPFLSCEKYKVLWIRTQPHTFIRKYKAKLHRPAKNKHTSLYGLFANDDEEKKFCEIVTWLNPDLKASICFRIPDSRANSRVKVR